MAISLLCLFSPFYAYANENNPIEIGSVLGRPLYEQDINTQSDEDFHADCNTLIVEPLIEEYYMENQDILTPTAKEVSTFMLYHLHEHEKQVKDQKKNIYSRIEAITNQLQNNDVSNKENDSLVAELYYLKTELEPPGHDYAMFILPYWKLQVHLYTQYGEGRILWQDRGYQAFDATYRWLQEAEKKGQFSIRTPEMKKRFYAFWTSKDHGDYLFSNTERISSLFLNPKWTR